MITLDKETTQVLIDQEYKRLELALKPKGKQQKKEVLTIALKNIEELLKDEDKFKEWLINQNPNGRRKTTDI